MTNYFLSYDMLPISNQLINDQTSSLSLLYSSCLCEIKEFSEMRFRSISKSETSRNEEAKGQRDRHELDASRQKAHQNLIDRPFPRLFTVCINASFGRKQFCRSTCGVAKTRNLASLETLSTRQATSSNGHREQREF